MESLEKDEDLPHRKKVSSVGSLSKLYNEYKEFLNGMVHEKPGIVLEEMTEQLNTQFMDLEIEKSALHEFLADKCHFFLRRVLSIL
ncbi:hypothetical protein F4703DRAFT_1854982 [Phycomyces blakesleeanus]